MSGIEVQIVEVSARDGLQNDPAILSTPTKVELVNRAVAAGLTRQALHAAVLGFVHPVTGEALRFETAPPEDMRRLEALLAEL